MTRTKPTKPEPGPGVLAVIFERPGEVAERKVALGTAQAALVAIGVILTKTELEVGDKLTVVKAWGDGK